jgi:chromosome segregation ATPase
VEVLPATVNAQAPPQEPAAQTAPPQSPPQANPVEALRGGLDAIRAGLNLIEELERTLTELRAERDLLAARLDQAKRRAEGLRGANEGLEKNLAEVTQQLNAAQGVVRELREKVEFLTSQLAEEQSGRAEDEKRFSEQIEREKQVTLNGFKGKLRGALHRIFDNKRTTDDQELSPELAGFYRSWFNEVEEKLKASGVQLD